MLGVHLKMNKGSFALISLFPILPKSNYAQMKFKLVFSILKEHYASLRLHSLSHFIAAHDSG